MSSLAPSPLTDTQIEELINFLPEDKDETRIALVKQLKNLPPESLEGFDEEDLKQLKSTLKAQYEQSIIAPGEAIGIKVSCAVAQPTNLDRS
jgi:hypothetical protein